MALLLGAVFSLAAALLPDVPAALDELLAVVFGAFTAVFVGSVCFGPLLVFFPADAFAAVDGFLDAAGTWRSDFVVFFADLVLSLALVFAPVAARFAGGAASDFGDAFPAFLVAGRLDATFFFAAFSTAVVMAAELFTAEIALVVARAALDFRLFTGALSSALADAALPAARFLGAASSFAMMGMLRFASSGSKLNAF
ncbi:hypothetical protein [Methyloligella halotolerans]|uniref:hypothetical protein n=1 Tax=Methyloligella halotolerans TaxID=1177755 RepID=UPI00083DF6B6|nr:hypothetical protein [Methyloligella halotolerans]